MIGEATLRVDAPLKTQGGARYAAEFLQPGMVHVTMVLSTIARGSVTGFDTRAAGAHPGVIAIITTDDAPTLDVRKPAQQTVTEPLLQNAHVRFQGQPIALVIADTPDASQQAATLVVPRYRRAHPVTEVDAALADAYVPSDFRGGRMPPDSQRGHPDEAFDSAPVKIDVVYETPAMYHNPMEPHATVASWSGDRLTVWTATQGVSGVQETLAAFFSLPPDHVRVICPYVGGGFGCKGNAWPPIALTAMAARHVGRPARLELSREQMYTNNGYRPQTRQALKLAADHNGKLLSIRHDGITQTSEPALGEFAEPVATATRMLYACAHVVTHHRVVAPHYSRPTYMRAPGEASGVFALECAIDELASALGMDPIELRLANHADHDGDTGKPFSSKHLREAYAKGAEMFGWHRRTAAPMRDGNVLIGWGMATSTYPANRAPASARVRLTADGRVLVQSGTQDLGTGTYTIMAQVAADILGLPMASVRAELGDTTLPSAPASGGSATAASVTPAVQMAASNVRARLFGLALNRPGWTNLSPADLSVEQGRVAGPHGTISYADLLTRAHLPSIEAEAGAKPAENSSQFSRHSFGAQFAEVRVDPDFGTVRVSRFVGVYDAGQIINAQTGRSQLLGGIVFGIGQALLEGATPDFATGRILNNSLSDYLVPVNADGHLIAIAPVGTPDLAGDQRGARGLGELPIVGAAAAVANAVHHATGRRIRRLPIRVEDVLA